MYLMKMSEHDKIIMEFRLVGLIALSVIGVGTVFYHAVENLKWLDSVYFSVISLATVGYGDITPHTDAGKIFTIFYVLIGIGIIGSFANLLIRRASLKHREKRENK